MKQWIGLLTLIAFGAGVIVAAVGLVAWVIVMLNDHDPKWTKRITLTAAAVAVGALLLNALT